MFWEHIQPYFLILLTFALIGGWHEWEYAEDAIGGVVAVVRADRRVVPVRRVVHWLEGIRRLR